MKNKYRVGDMVYLKPEGNNARYTNSKTKAGVIDRVGNSYVYVRTENDKIFKFDKETRYENNGYSATWRLYFSNQEILDEEEVKKISQELQRALNYSAISTFSLDQLKRIVGILKEGEQ